jgi:hypothetical protein
LEFFISKRVGLNSLAFLACFAGVSPAVANSPVGQPKTFTNFDGQQLTIQAYSDGARVGHKYVVTAGGSANTWYSQTSAKNKGKHESGRVTSMADWCRVHYLMGHDVRQSEPCKKGFMYSSWVVTGLDGTHYELWFKPASLEYWKIATAHPSAAA